MISLIPLGGFGVDPATSTTAIAPAPTKPPMIQRLQVRALSSWDALLLGIVTGFAMSAGTLIFNKLARRFRWE